jgi:serine/threonine protein kinase
MDRLQEIIEAMNDPSNLLIPGLSSHRPVPGRRGFRKAVGSYCIVIALQRGGEAHPSKCLRFWYNEGERSRRLHESARRIASVLRTAGSPFFCMQDYHERALRLSDGTVIPATVMDWMPRSLDQWLSSDDKPTSYEYADMARQMREISGFMKRNGITHGDLAPANILVGGDVRLKLIDFDSLEWPAMEIRCGEPGIAGVPRFNRRERLTKPRTPADDHLAQQLIHLMLLAYSRNPGLNTASSGEEAFLFDESEIASAPALRRSASYGRIARSGDPELVHYLQEVEKALSCPYAEVKPLCDVIYRGDGVRRRKILEPAPYCGGCGHHFENEEEKYCPDCGTRRERVTL